VPGGNGSGCGFAGSIASLIPAQNRRHILSALVYAAQKPLFGLPKRRKQPERYAQYGLKLVQNNKIFNSL
jgi:hypothetical protein